jgi:hypothetical protein
MDFIKGLATSNGHSFILVAVDRFTKYNHFYPLMHPFSVQTVANVFLNNVIKLHRVPRSIVSDRDKAFTSNFWQCLFKSVHIDLQLSSAYHPQTDGQTE